VRVELAIERVVLEGVTLSFAQRARLAAALESELGRSLARTGVKPTLKTSGTVPHLMATTTLASDDPRGLAHGITTGVQEVLGR
jgi:hypothetical protein